MQKGMTRITAWTYVCQLRAVFARWCRPYYKDAGWDVPVLELPVFRAQAPRYVRPCADMMKRVKAWYRGLEGEEWFAATMMLEFAMRNGDVLRLKKENFVERDTKRFLVLCSTQDSPYIGATGLLADPCEHLAAT